MSSFLTSQSVSSETFDLDQKQNLATTYSYWRLRILYSIVIGYAAFYLIRQNLSIASLSMMQEFGFDKKQIGIIFSVNAAVYGLGKSFWGILSDRSNARSFMVIGLGLSALANIFMSMSSSLTAFVGFWALNACFLSMGAPPCIRLLTHWFSPKELATKWAIWNAAQPIGAGIIAAVGSYLITSLGWRSVFYMPAIFCLGMCVFLYNRLRDTPQSLGLPSIEEHHKVHSTKGKKTDDNHTMSEVFFHNVIKNKKVWYVAIANFFFYILRFGLLNWAPTFLREVKGSTIYGAGYQTAAFDVAAVFGGLFIGYLSDKTFKVGRGPVGVISCFILAFFVFCLWYVSSDNIILNTLLLVMIGFFISGPQILVGVAAADFASKKAAGAANGFTGTFGYLGASFSGIGIGWIVELHSWDYAFIFFCLCALISAFFFSLISRKSPKIAENL